LSATPLEDDAHGFFRLLQLLRPQEFPEEMSFEARLALATPLPPCTSSTRRADIGGLPPRVGNPIAIDHPSKWQQREAVEAGGGGGAGRSRASRACVRGRTRCRTWNRRSRAPSAGRGDGRERPAARVVAV